MPDPSPSSLGRTGGPRPDGPPDRGVDLLVMTAVAVAAVMPMPFLAQAGGLEAGSLEPVAWVVLAIACGAIYFRRSYPLTVALITMACSLAYYPLSELDGPMLVTFAVALYTLAAEGWVLAASLLSATMFGVIAVTAVLNEFAHVSPVAIVLMTGWFIAVVAIGALVDRYRAYRRQTEHAMTEARLRSATEERLRIAREMHDVLGHNISLIRVQASAALRKTEKDPEYSARAALEVINDTSHETLRELRSTLGVLRQVDEKSPVSPAPGLARLASLVESTRSLGVAVTVDIKGNAVQLPAPIDLAAYRIIQEALTNVAKHAEVDSATVSVAYRDDSLCVTIDDDGAGGQPTAGGGMTSMRGRAEALGGTFSAGPKDQGGFCVAATLPLEEGS